MSVREKLLQVQVELKAPKSQRNNFGNYNYRSCEDILESVKPLLLKHNLTLTIGDEIVLIGDRYYVKATATITDANESTSVSAYAREENEKKGMDASQVTGSTSSYARKYALNGLFAIDDTKDSDALNTEEKPQEKKTTSYNDYSKQPEMPKTDGVKLASESQKELLKKLCREKGVGQKAFVKICGTSLDDPNLTSTTASSMIDVLYKYNGQGNVAKTEEIKITPANIDVSDDDLPF